MNEYRIRRLDVAELQVHTFESIQSELFCEADLSRSSGPWLAFADQTVLFDATDAGYGLGFNAGALFGTVQHQSSWTGDWTDVEFRQLVAAMQGFCRRKQIPEGEVTDTVTPASLIRHYIAENVIDQFEDQVEHLSTRIREVLHVTGFGHHANLRTCRRSILVNYGKNTTEVFLRLAQRGVLAQITPDNTIAIRLPVSISDRELRWLAETLAAAEQRSIVPDTTVWRLRDNSLYYRFHKRLIDEKLLNARGMRSDLQSIISFIRDSLPDSLEGAEITVVNREDWPTFRHEVDAMQKLVYEPARQTSMKKFDQVINDETGIGLIVRHNGAIAGMVFAGRMSLFSDERGTESDPYRENPGTLYMLDLTVAPAWRGSLGRIMKQSITLLAVAAGNEAIHGRNRDRLAAGMWAINLGMGSYQTKHLENDYPDQNRFRDCIYYRCPLRWTTAAPLHVSKSIDDRTIAALVNGRSEQNAAEGNAVRKTDQPKSPD